MLLPTVIRPLGIAAAIAIASTAMVARADVAAVNKYLDQATELVGKGPQFYDDARGKLDLAEASMDDVSEADKGALKAKIDALKAKVNGAANEQAKKSLESHLQGSLTNAEEAIGNLVTWKGSADEVNAILNDPKAAELVGADAIAAARKQFATFEKLNASKALKANLDSTKPDVEQLEKDWAERKTTLADKDASPNARSSAIEDTQHDLEGLERSFANLPADNADVKALRGRVDKVKADMGAAASAAGANEAVTEIDRFLESYKNEFDGWEKETAPPSLADYKARKLSANGLGAPKTAAFVSRVGDYLDKLPESETYKAAKDAPAVKARVDELDAQVAAGQEKLKKNAEALVAALEAEKANANNLSEAGLLAGSIRNALGNDFPGTKPLFARLEKFEKDFRDAGDKADVDKDAYYKSMTEQADKAWPAMMAKFDVADGFDANNAGAMKGKYIKIESNNLMGWRFKPTDFPYATTLSGVPVAGRYDPVVKAALAEVESKIGRSIGDSDDDGKWIAICRVEGTTGRLVELVKHEGDVNVDGSKVGTVSGTEERPVDAPIVTIVALKAGPVAAAAGQGAVKQDGSVGKSTPGTAAPLAAAGSSGSSGTTAGTTAGTTGVAVAAGRGIGTRLWAIFTGLVAVLIGGVALMKARFAPLAANAGAVQLTNRIGESNQTLLGFAGIGWGALTVLLGLIAIAGSLFGAFVAIATGLAMLVSGFVISSDAPALAGVVKPDLAAKIKSFAVPAGLTCAAFGVIGLLMALIP